MAGHADRWMDGQMDIHTDRETWLVATVEGSEQHQLALAVTMSIVANS